MQILINFNPKEIDIAEKLVKRIKEAHPGFNVRFNPNGLINGLTVHNFELNDGHYTIKKRR